MSLAKMEYFLNKLVNFHSNYKLISSTDRHLIQFVHLQRYILYKVESRDSFERALSGRRDIGTISHKDHTNESSSCNKCGEVV